MAMNVKMGDVFEAKYLFLICVMILKKYVHVF